MAGLLQNVNRYLHYGGLLKYPRRIVKRILSTLYPITIRIWPLPEVATIEETINKIKKDRLSIARFGDGEILYLVNKLNLPFQKYDGRLANYLKKILLNNEPGLLVGLPDGLRDYRQFTEEIQSFWRSQISFTYPRFYHYLNHRSEYYNANITRLYFGYRDQSKSGYYFNLMRSIWENREVLLLEGEKSRLGMGNDLFSQTKEVKRILAPAHHAFSKFDALRNEVRKYTKDHLVLIALGPAAKALSFELTREGYQCLDIGNLDVEYEWFMMGAKKRVKLEGKYTSEVVGGRDVNETNDTTYLKQIVARHC